MSHVLASLGVGALLAHAALPLLARRRALLPAEPASRHQALLAALWLSAALFTVPWLRDALGGATALRLEALEVIGVAARWRAQASSLGSPLAALGALWLAATALWLARLLIRGARLQLRCARARPAPAALQARADSLARTLGLAPVPVLLCEQEPLPFATGLLRPRVVLPAALACSLDPARLALVLRHELLHLARGDVRASTLAALPRAAFALHPTARWLWRELTVAREEAVDAAVAGPTPAPYAHLLVDLAQAASTRRGLSLVSMGDTALHRRIAMLGQSTLRPVARRLPLFATAAACAALALLAPRVLSSPPGEGHLDKEQIRGVVSAGKEGIRQCYEALLAAGSAGTLDVVASFTIAPDGKVSGARAPSAHATFSSCLEGQISGWTFPAPSGGGVVHVRYPFHFAGAPK